MINAMTVDVEDYYQVSAFASTVARSDWDRLPARVEGNTERVLDLFAAHGARATFFTLGWVAKRFPRLVRRIVEAGHELASHGMAHVRVDEQDARAFAEDIGATKRLLEDTAGAPVRGYRAASFSIGAKTPWAFAVLAEQGYAYSSSVYPIRHDHYGVPDAPRAPYRPLAGHPFVEVPITTVRAFNRNFPCGGGGYFRLLPPALSMWAMRRVNRAEGRPCIFYFHPWEIDPGQPRVPGLPARARFRHYTNLERMEGRLGRLLTAFRWGRVDQVFSV